MKLLAVLAMLPLIVVTLALLGQTEDGFWQSVRDGFLGTAIMVLIVVGAFALLAGFFWGLTTLTEFKP